MPTVKVFSNLLGMCNEELWSLATKCRKKFFIDFLNFKENWQWKICSPYVCIANLLQNLQYIKKAFRLRGNNKPLKRKIRSPLAFRWCRILYYTSNYKNLEV